MEDQRLKEHAQYVELRCLESGRYNPYNSIRIEQGLDNSNDWMSSPCFTYHTNQAYVQSWAIRPPAPEIKIRVTLTL